MNCLGPVSGSLVGLVVELRLVQLTPVIMRNLCSAHLLDVVYDSKLCTLQFCP